MNKEAQLSTIRLLVENKGDACLICTFVNQYYLTGRLFKGYVYLPAEGETLFFVQREADLPDSQVHRIRKPEDIPGILKSLNYPLPKTLFLEAGQIPYNDFLRLETIFSPAKTGDATALLRRARMIKSAWEIEQIRISAGKHVEAYGEIPSLFRPGMRDIDFQIEIERLMRRHGSLGVFRTFGDMDIFMGSLLTGDNASAPSPYDFALGGAGMSPCLPVGCSGETIHEGNAVMIDFAGNFTAYLSDMTRVLAFGKLPSEVLRAHQLSIDMQARLEEEVREGVTCSSIWRWSLAMAEEAGFGGNFMGTRFRAKFVGHGIGLEINEPPVLTARSEDVFLENMVFAYEPKFVFEGVGAVGNENTFIVHSDGIERLTTFDETIGQLAI